MPRPSKKEQRREEILDAYERCVIRYGVEGATLQRVADASGLARPLLHHNLGNRDDLLAALIARYEARLEGEDSAFRQLLPTEDRCRAMLDLLFDARYASDYSDLLLYQALLVAAQEHESLHTMLRRWYEKFVDDVAREIAAECPGAPGADVRVVALGIVALYFNVDAMATLVPDTGLHRDSHAAARRLLETLPWNG